MIRDFKLDITTIASGSDGNCYCLDDGETPIMIEAGIPLKKIRRALPVVLSEIQGILLSHEHRDHSGFIHQIRATDIYATAGTFESLDVPAHHKKVVRQFEQFRIGTWSIKPFPTIHDANDPCGFLLASGSHKIIFVTDTMSIDVIVPGLTHIMLECNYSRALLDKSVKQGIVSEYQKERIVNNHHSLESVIDFLTASDLSKVEEIHLLHLSRDNSDDGYFKTTVQGLFGIPVYVATYQLMRRGG